MSFANIFSHSIGCLLVLLIASFAVQKLFYFDEVPVVHFCFCFPCLWRCVKKLLWPRTKRFLLAFSSRILVASCLTLRYFVHFEFIFVYGIRKWSRFVLLHVAVQFSQHHLLKRLSLFHWIAFLLCQRLVGHTFVGPFLGSLFCCIDPGVCFCASTILS